MRPSLLRTGEPFTTEDAGGAAWGERRKAAFWGLMSLLVGGPAVGAVGALAGGPAGALVGLAVFVGVAFLPAVTVGAGARRTVQEHRAAAAALEAALFDAWPWATMAFVVIILAAHGAAQVGPQDWEIRAFARSNPELLRGQLWRLWTPAPVHADAQHVAGNALAIFFVGGAVERILGRWRFLGLLLVGIAAGNFGSAVVYPRVVAIGASGAVFAAVVVAVVVAVIGRIPPASRAGAVAAHPPVGASRAGPRSEPRPP